MASEKLTYEDFILAVDSNNKPFVENLHSELIAKGVKIEVKEAKSGYMVSYLYNKKTIFNYVFRKSGIIIRIYGNNVRKYMEFLDTLPDNMIKEIIDAPVCRRLVNPQACNSKCAMGYEFILKNENYQKCRINAFMFQLSEENNPYIKKFLEYELSALA